MMIRCEFFLSEVLKIKILMLETFTIQGRIVNRYEYLWEALYRRDLNYLPHSTRFDSYCNRKNNLTIFDLNKTLSDDC